MKRVIKGCFHTLERMTAWCNEGACPICKTAEAGMLRQRLSEAKVLLSEGLKKPVSGHDIVRWELDVKHFLNETTH